MSSAIDSYDTHPSYFPAGRDRGAGGSLTLGAGGSFTSLRSMMRRGGGSLGGDGGCAAHVRFRRDGFSLPG
jgi:hypothetical protein